MLMTTVSASISRADLGARLCAVSFTGVVLRNSHSDPSRDLPGRV